MTKKQRTESPMTTEAIEILAETAFHVGLGMGRNDPARTFNLTEKARQYWLEGHMQSIPTALKRSTANWKIDRSEVNSAAEELGSLAATYAIEDGQQGEETVEVLKAHVKKATRQVRKNHKCRRAGLGWKPGDKDGGKDAGRGGYCEGPW
ncbi:MAG: hypothetical protein U0Q55_04505 [Vicinamibacterales bacterium]